MLESLITKGIKITVEAFYNEKHSRPDSKEFVYSYDVEIENTGDQTVQLLRRHWIIRDSLGPIREVEGEGVIGEKPVLEPGQSHKYTSWCPLQTDIGKMSGTYLMLNVETKEEFYVQIPEFKLIASLRLN